MFQSWKQLNISVHNVVDKEHISAFLIMITIFDPVHYYRNTFVFYSKGCSLVLSTVFVCCLFF